MANNFFKQLLDEQKRQIEKGARLLLIDEADKVIAQAKRLTPVDTGHLRGSFFRSDVTVRDNVFGIDVINNVNYAIPIEMGHTTSSRKGWVLGFFMLTQAIEKMSVGFNKRLAEIVPTMRK